MLRVLADMAGAQAQIASAAQLSLWARVRGLRRAEVEAAITPERSIAKTACMRRTLHLIPSAEISMFARGTAKRAERDVRWILNKGATAAELDRVLAAVLEAFSSPLTRSELIAAVASKLDVRPALSADGWWGSTRQRPSIPVGPIACPPNYLLTLAGARGIICYGDYRGNEPTFVRADAWLPGADDLSVEEAEDALLRRYLRSYGPATTADFAAWTGMRKVDAAVVWRRAAGEILPVDVEGTVAYVLPEDLGALLHADIDRATLRLLPYFDAYLLGHAERDVVAREHSTSVYRKQGWVSSVVLVGGAVRGTWSYQTKGKLLMLRVTPFSPLPRGATRAVQREGESLASFLGYGKLEVAFGE